MENYSPFLWFNVVHAKYNVHKIFFPANSNLYYWFLGQQPLSKDLHFHSYCLPFLIHQEQAPFHGSGKKMQQCPKNPHNDLMAKNWPHPSFFHLHRLQELNHFNGFVELQWSQNLLNNAPCLLVGSENLTDLFYSSNQFQFISGSETQSRLTPSSEKILPSNAQTLSHWDWHHPRPATQKPEVAQQSETDVETFPPEQNGQNFQHFGCFPCPQEYQLQVIVLHYQDEQGQQHYRVHAHHPDRLHLTDFLTISCANLSSIASSESLRVQQELKQWLTQLDWHISSPMEENDERKYMVQWALYYALCLSVFYKRSIQLFWNTPAKHDFMHPLLVKTQKKCINNTIHLYMQTYCKAQNDSQKKKITQGIQNQISDFFYWTNVNHIHLELHFLPAKNIILYQKFFLVKAFLQNVFSSYISNECSEQKNTQDQQLDQENPFSAIQFSPVIQQNLLHFLEFNHFYKKQKLFSPNRLFLLIYTKKNITCTHLHWCAEQSQTSMDNHSAQSKDSLSSNSPEHSLFMLVETTENLIFREIYINTIFINTQFLLTERQKLFLTEMIQSIYQKFISQTSYPYQWLPATVSVQFQYLFTHVPAYEPFELSLQSDNSNVPAHWMSLEQFLPWHQQDFLFSIDQYHQKQEPFSADESSLLKNDLELNYSFDIKDSIADNFLNKQQWIDYKNYIRLAMQMSIDKIEKKVKNSL